MSGVLFTTIVILGIAVIAVLAMGLVNMVRVKSVSDVEKSSARANRLMRWRIYLQLFAVALVVLMILLSRG